MQLFDPFSSLSFSEKECFLTGRNADLRIPVFPQWFQDKFNLQNKPFKLLNEEMTSFGGLDLPCNADAYERHLLPLEKEMEIAFTNGFQGLKKITEIKVFQWFSRLLYGIVYAELQVAFKEHQSNEPLGISPSLISRFRNLHLLLQSIWLPMEFEDFQPWSLEINKLVKRNSGVQASPDMISKAFDADELASRTDEEPTFHELDYRDEMSTMVFSLAFGDVAIIIALQDAGRNALYHKKLNEKIAANPLNSMQVRELHAKYFYSAYLFQPIPQYIMLPPTENDPLFSISLQALEGAGLRPVFNAWDNAVFAQVLEAFWKPWGIKKSALIDQEGRMLTSLLDNGAAFINNPNLTDLVYC